MSYTRGFSRQCCSENGQFGSIGMGFGCFFTANQNLECRFLLASYSVAPGGGVGVLGALQLQGCSPEGILSKRVTSGSRQGGFK